MNGPTQEPVEPTAEEIAIAHRVASFFAKKRSKNMTDEHRRKVADNARMHGGRRPKGPVGEARAELRKELERVLGQKPLPKEGPVAKLVHIMTSANVLHRTWPEVRRMLPVVNVPTVADKLDGLLEQLGGSKLTYEERTGVKLPADHSGDFDPEQVPSRNDLNPACPPFVEGGGRMSNHTRQDFDMPSVSPIVLAYESLFVAVRNYRLAVAAAEASGCKRTKKMLDWREAIDMARDTLRALCRKAEQDAYKIAHLTN